MNLATTASFLATHHLHSCHGFLPQAPRKPIVGPVSMTRLSTMMMMMVSASESSSSSSQLAQLAGMTTLSIDSGDLKVIEEYAKTGYITDATTNPLFVSQAGLSGDPTYAEVSTLL
jgi:hypothetical protein